MTGKTVILRDALPADVTSYLRWQTQGEWRTYDAPWEGIRTSLSEAQEETFRQQFLDRCGQMLSTPRHTATIAARDNQPLGWVNRYAHDRFPETWFVGINLCEDTALNQGLGTEALALWVDYLFSNSNIHRLSLDTWSFNPRMRRVAEKVGFVYEGAQREMIEWQGSWLDWVHYGLLRQEWEGKQRK
jgi:RimJ/RimL family protein N-acetyltransferase